MDGKTSHAIHTVEVSKRPGQGLGLFLREGNGVDRADGVFVSRLAPGSAADQNDLLRVGDEILAVNSTPVAGRRLEDIAISISIHRNLVLTLKTVTSPDACPSVETTSSSSISSMMTSLAVPRAPVVVVKGGGRTYRSTSGRRSKSPERLRSPDVMMTGSRRMERTSGDRNLCCPRSVSVDFRRLEELAVTSETVAAAQSSCFFADDSGDSGLSSDNSGFCLMSVDPPGKAKTTTAAPDALAASSVSPVGSIDAEGPATPFVLHLNSSDARHHHHLPGPRWTVHEGALGDDGGCALWRMNGESRGSRASRGQRGPLGDASDHGPRHLNASTYGDVGEYTKQTLKGLHQMTLNGGRPRLPPTSMGSGQSGDIYGLNFRVPMNFNPIIFFDLIAQPLIDLFVKTN